MRTAPKTPGLPHYRFRRYAALILPVDIQDNSRPAARNGSGKIRVAIIGVGNCASSLVQGVEFYKNANPEETVPGLMHVELGGYHIRDIEFTAAFDMNHTKVGKDLSQAIFAEPNNTY